MSRRVNVGTCHPDAAAWLDAWLQQDNMPARREDVLGQLDAQARFAQRLIEQGATPRRQRHLNRLQAACGAASQVLRETWNERHQPH